ncbi:MAG: glycosyltransferase family 39 protein [Thermoanaerobaculia bacterium]|nr:glycosyltransferase family 39 protein [Thermoanaerobaculia bacterium]
MPLPPLAHSRTWIAVATVAAALALRLPGHLGSGLWFDEILTLVDVGRAPLGAVVGGFSSDNHHPLYSLLAWFSLRACGESAWALRLPAVLFGALSVGMLYLYAARVASRGEALFAAALLATSYHHVWFSQNARGYTMLLCFALAASYAFERLVEAGDRRAVAPYVAAVALAVYTHLTAAFLVAGHLVALVVYRRSRRGPPAAGARRRLPLTAVALAGVAAALLYAPMAREAFDLFARKAAEAAAMAQAATTGATAANPWRSPRWALEAVIASLGLGAAGLAALAAAAALLAAGALDLARRQAWRFVGWVVPGAALAVVLLALGRNLWPRFFFFLAGFVLIVLVRGLAQLGAAVLPAGGRARTIAALALLALWSTLLPRAYALPKQDFEGARDYLARVRGPGEAVATVGLAAMPYRRYYATDYVEVASVAELDALAAASSGVYVVSTLPVYLASRTPALAAAVASRGREVARFRGGVGDGDVVVLRLEGAAGAAAGES